jgi:hypothetical protein
MHCRHADVANALDHAFVHAALAAYVSKPEASLNLPIPSDLM